MALKIGFWSEQETQVGHSYSNRLHELVRETLLAEQMGFDFVAVGTTLCVGWYFELCPGSGLWLSRGRHLAN